MAIPIQRAFLFYPPGPLYQRGEDRSQGNIGSSTATVMRAPNDMGYVAAQLKQRGIDVIFRDYPVRRESMDVMISDVRQFRPDIVIASITTSTLHHDMGILRAVRDEFPGIRIIIKGALFFQADQEILADADLGVADFLIGGEIEFSAARIIDVLNGGEEDIATIPFIYYHEKCAWKESARSARETFDDLPFPDRSVIDNHLYVRPDTGEPQATIDTSRGCPAACVYCLTPAISGRSVRFRDPQSILEELRTCYYDHGIRNFFFRSDTFTIDHEWVSALCHAIIGSDLHGKIEWVANSRVRPLHGETLHLMRRAGCWLVAFGFETGSEETMKRIKKGATIADNLRAAKLAKAAGLKLYGFFLVGLPWEEAAHLAQTRRHMLDIDADFIELHIAVPYYNTELRGMMKEEGLLQKSVIGQNYFDDAATGTKFLSSSELVVFRRRTLLLYHLRPSYLVRRLSDAGLDVHKLANYARFGLRLLKNSFKPLPSDVRI